MTEYSQYSQLLTDTLPMTEYSQYSQLLTDTYLAYDGVLIDRLADHARPLLQLDNLDPLELLELRHVELVDDLQPPPSVPKCDAVGRTPSESPS